MDQDASNKSNNEREKTTCTTKEDPYKWKNLMGDDIQFRYINMCQNPNAAQPEVHDYVKLSYKGYILEDISSSLSSSSSPSSSSKLFIEKHEVIITLGESEIPPCLEMGIRFCPVGSSAEVKSHSKFGYGHVGRKAMSKSLCAIPPNSSLYFSFQVLDVIENLNDLEQAQLKKQAGNESFQYDFDHGERAIKLWNKAIGILDSAPDATSSPSIPKMKIDLLNNIALAHYNKKAYIQAKATCLKITTDLDTKNKKAWIRLAYTLLALDAEFDDIYKVIQSASSVSPGGMENVDVRKVYSLFYKKKKEYHKTNKEIGRKMMKDYQTKEELEQVNTKEEKKNVLDFTIWKYSGTFEMLLVLVLALFFVQLYYNPVLTETIKSPFMRLQNFFSMI